MQCKNEKCLTLSKRKGASKSICNEVVDTRGGQQELPPMFEEQKPCS